MFYATGLTGWQRAAMNVPEADTVAPQPQAVSPQEEIEMLKAQADAAAATLERVRQRIDEIAAQSATPSANQ